MDPAREEPPRRVTHDGRRLITTALSLAIPGLGQLVNGRPRAAIVFFGPMLLVAALALGLFEFVGPARFAAWAIVPDRLQALLNLNIAIAAWRLIAAAHAFFDARYPRLPGRVGVVGGILAAVLIVAPHAYGAQVGASAGAAMARIFSGGTVGATASASGSGGQRPAAATTPISMSRGVG